MNNEKILELREKFNWDEIFGKNSKAQRAIESFVSEALTQADQEGYVRGLEKAKEITKRQYLEPIPEAEGADIDDYMKGVNTTVDTILSSLTSELEDKGKDDLEDKKENI
jgi:hypothetical protein